MQYNTCNRSSVKIVDVFRPKVFHSGGRNVFNNMRMLIALHSIFVGCKSTEEHGSIGFGYAVLFRVLLGTVFWLFALDCSFRARVMNSMEAIR